MTALFKPARHACPKKATKDPNGEGERESGMATGRNILAVLGGVIAASLIIAATEAVGHDSLQGNARFGAAIFGYGLGALAGTATAKRIVSSRAPVAVPVILAGLAAINLFSFPHPKWFAPAAVAALALGWLAGSRLNVRLFNGQAKGGLGH